MMTKIWKVDRVLAAALVAVGVSAGAMMLQSCGSSSASAGDYKALCNQSCDKATACFGGDAGGLGAQGTALCKQNCSAQATTTMTCTNSTAIFNAFKACVDGTCEAYIACATSVPQCQGGGTGTGGSSGGGTGGSGGSSGGGTGGSAGGGTGGSSGNASCGICDKAGACCTAYLTSVGMATTQCASYSTATCNGVPAAQQSTIVTACMTFITLGAGANISACQ